MSYFKTKNIIGKFELKGFDGIDLSSPSESGKCSEMLNMRILSDKSLVKRDGFTEVYDFLDNVRAVMSGTFNGEFLTYVVAANWVYKFGSDIKKNTLLGKIDTNTGDASIFCYLGKIYVADGNKLYEVRGSSLVVVDGYVPQLGKDWGSNYPGEIYEPLNMLNPRARISYIVDDPPTAFLSTLYSVSSVDAVYVNGELRSSSTYTIDARLKILSVSSLNAGDRVLVYYTFQTSGEARSKLWKNTQATVFGGINNSRVFMWGGNEKNRIFASSPVPQSSIDEAEAQYPNSGGLYFPENNNFCVGDGRHDIKAVSRHYDRLLIFTSGETWMADSEVSAFNLFPITRINTDIGCSVAGGVAKCGNDPISVGHGNIYRWTSNTDTLEDCNAYIISDKVRALLPDSFFEEAKVFTDKHNKEVLFAYTQDGEDKILVYSILGGEWYIYDGIHVDHFFEWEKNLGFINGGKVCIFEKGKAKDEFLNHYERDINSYCSYSPNDFGHSTRKKRISGIMGVGELKQSPLKISFESERDVGKEVVFTGGERDRIECFYKRERGERFLNTRIKISPDAKVQQRIYALTVSVRA